MTISRHVIEAYKEDYGDDWQMQFNLQKRRLDELWADHDQCPECRGNGFTKAEVHMMPMHALARMAADPILAKQPIPVFKHECRKCQGAGVIIRSMKP